MGQIKYYNLLLEDGTSKLQLEAGSGFLLLEADDVFSYSSASDVSALIPNLLNSACSFVGMSTVPASTVLRNFMQSGYSKINSYLRSNGYFTPISASSTIYEFLIDTEAAYVAQRAELARSSPRVSADERSRFEGYREQFNKGLQRITAVDLTEDKVYNEKEWYISGTRESIKQDMATDDDRIQSRFQRRSFDGLDEDYY